jgi:hypothetical protein
VKMNDIRFEIAGRFKTAATVRNPQRLPIQMQQGHTVFTLPELRDYELVVLE